MCDLQQTRGWHTSCHTPTHHIYSSHTCNTHVEKLWGVKTTSALQPTECLHVYVCIQPCVLECIWAHLMKASGYRPGAQFLPADCTTHSVHNPPLRAHAQWTVLSEDLVQRRRTGVGSVMYTVGDGKQRDGWGGGQRKFVGLFQCESAAGGAPCLIPFFFVLFC